MIELHTWSHARTAARSPSCSRSAACPTSVHPVDIGKGEQFKPEFLAISPNNKIPAIVDPDGPGGKRFALFESGAILIYLAEKTGQVPARRTRRRATSTLQWLMFQMGGVGPMLGQAHHFLRAAPEQDRPTRSSATTTRRKRLYGVLDKRLAEAEHLAGEYSIADIAILSVGGAPRMAPDRPRRFPERQALVRRDRRPAGGAARHEGAGLRLPRWPGSTSSSPGCSRSAGRSG